MMRRRSVSRGVLWPDVEGHALSFEFNIDVAHQQLVMRCTPIVGGRRASS
jgi:hypothetical protein